MLTSSAHGKCNSNTDSDFDCASMFTFSFSTTSVSDNNITYNSTTHLKRRYESDDFTENCKPSKVPRVKPLSINARLTMHFMSAVPTVRYNEAHAMAICAVAKLHTLHADTRDKRITRGIRCCSGHFRSYHFAPKTSQERCNCARGVISACIKTLAQQLSYNSFVDYASKRRRIYSKREHLMTSAEYVNVCITERKQAKQIQECKQISRRLRERCRILVNSANTITSSGCKTAPSTRSATSTVTIGSPATTATTCTGNKTPTSISSASTRQSTLGDNTGSADTSVSGQNRYGNKDTSIASKNKSSYRISNNTKVGVEVGTTVKKTVGNKDSLGYGGKPTFDLKVPQISPDGNIDRVQNAPVDALRRSTNRFFDTLGGLVNFVNILAPQTAQIATDNKFSDENSDTDSGYDSYYSLVSDDFCHRTSYGSTVDRLAIIFQATARIGIFKK
ncbi:hypothetical protein LPJ73_002710 [Coemansia sp. RSA 2703]|nr:hypothetical protein LPJ73_002710 [Coemansia sp. RSA 2703]